MNTADSYTASESETEYSKPTDALRQGDIIQLEHPHGSAYAFNFGVIINADCDMIQKKHDGVISFLPLYSFGEYLTEFWLASYIKQIEGSATKRLKDAAPISDAHILDLQRLILNRNSETQIDSNQVLAAYKLGTANLRIASESIKKLENCATARKMQHLSALKLFAPANPKDAVKFYQDAITNAKKQMADDHFFVSEIRTQKEIGYVVRMRRIYSLAASNCFQSQSELTQRDQGNMLSAFRICRLSSKYKFKVAQLFAQQYSRIGLSDDLTALSTLAIDQIVANLTKE